MIVPLILLISLSLNNKFGAHKLHIGHHISYSVQYGQHYSHTPGPVRGVVMIAMNVLVVESNYNS